MVARGHVWLLGACMVARGHAWLLRGHAWLLGGGGVHGCWGGHVWLLGDMHGCAGACMIVGV